MLNQLIGVSGTIVAAIIGFIALIISNANSNHHALELEKLRIEAEESKEKAKRQIAAIEEIYQILLRVEDMCQQLAYDVRYSNDFTLDILGGIKQIRSTSQRILVLTHLYFPMLNETLKEHQEQLGHYWNAIGSLFEGRKAELSQTIISDRNTELTEKEKAYQKSLERFRMELEQLVK